MSDPGMMQKLAAMLRSQSSPQMGGMAGGAQQDMQMMPRYKEYVINAQSAGEQAMPFEQFQSMLQQQGPSQGQGQMAQAQPMPQQQPAQPFRF